MSLEHLASKCLSILYAKFCFPRVGCAFKHEILSHIQSKLGKERISIWHMDNNNRKIVCINKICWKKMWTVFQKHHNHFIRRNRTQWLSLVVKTVCPSDCLSGCIVCFPPVVPLFPLLFWPCQQTILTRCVPFTFCLTPVARRPAPFPMPPIKGELFRQMAGTSSVRCLLFASEWVRPWPSLN